MKERTISTTVELSKVIDTYDINRNGRFYFRGENRDFGETACLPYHLRDWVTAKCDARQLENGEWLQKKLQELGVGFPYRSPEGDTDEDMVNFAFANIPSYSFSIWGAEKFEAFIKHYAPDLNVLYKEELGRHYSVQSNYLDITSDIMVALHFACSEYRFYHKDDEPPQEQENTDNGVLFVFDVKGIRKAEFLQFIYHPNYAYFCKEKIVDDKLYFQSFDRITHQRGAFLAQKPNKKGKILYESLKQEIQKKYVREKIIIASDLKKKLYEIFGGETGMDYYFPKIPCMFPKEGNAIQQRYSELKSITLMQAAPEKPPPDY
jgi:hypothetical protein